MGFSVGESLSEELRAWCRANGLPYLGANDLRARDDLPAVQQAWLERFCARWDEFMASETARDLPLKTSLELAGAFVSVLRDVLGEGHLGLCMTGRLEVDDACDSNAIMGAAFMRVHGRDPWMPSDVDGGRCDERGLERDFKLWNEALAIFRSHIGRSL